MSTEVSVFITLAILWVILRAFKNVFGGASSARSKGGPGAKRPLAAEQFTWPNLNEFAFEVVGESNYQRTLRQHAGDHASEYAQTKVIAELVPDDGNEHDASAVQVVVDGDTVGYLSRHDARSFRRRLGSKGLSGQRTFCAAMIVGGCSMRDSATLSYGVKLDLKPFDS